VGPSTEGDSENEGTGGPPSEERGDGGNVVAAADEASTDVLVRKASKKVRQVCRELPLICTWRVTIE